MILETLMNKLESATKNVLDSFRTNGMKLNSNRCKVLVCGHKFESVICKIVRNHEVQTIVNALYASKVVKLRK